MLAVADWTLTVNNRFRSGATTTMWEMSWPVPIAQSILFVMGSTRPIDFATSAVK
jgi:hypothetical protein